MATRWPGTCRAPVLGLSEDARALIRRWPVVIRPGTSLDYLVTSPLKQRIDDAFYSWQGPPRQWGIPRIPWRRLLAAWRRVLLLRRGQLGSGVALLLTLIVAGSYVANRPGQTTGSAVPAASSTASPLLGIPAAGTPEGTILKQSGPITVTHTGPHSYRESGGPRRYRRPSEQCNHPKHPRCG